MPEDNPNLDIPIEDEGQMSQGTDGRTELSLEELEAEIARRNKKVKEDNQPAKNPNHVDPLEIDPNDKPTEEPEEEEEVQGDPRFVGKTTEELTEMYMNLEKLQKSQTDELGTLRKENKTFKEQDTLSQSFDMKDIEKRIMPEVESWDAEKKQEWFDLFNKEPEKALAQVVRILVKPMTKKLVVGERRDEILRLKVLHKDSVVPYVEKDINALIATNPDWWNEYGTGVFNHAYNEVRDRDFDKYAEKRQPTKEVTEPKPKEVTQNTTYVEGQRPTKLIKKAKVVTKAMRDKMTPAQAMANIEATLLKRGVKVDKQ